MSEKLNVFVSSVQKELEDERVIVQNLLSTDAFLAAHCTPVLYEFEPASPDLALAGCLKSLDGCQVYLLIVAAQYGTVAGGVSITHAEYRRAKEKGLPVLAFIKGDRKVTREAGTEALLRELDADGPKYKRFGNVIELQREVRAALVKLLKDPFGLVPSSDENEIAAQTIEATSPFESQPLTRLRWANLDHEVARRLIAAAEGRAADRLSKDDSSRGRPCAAWSGTMRRRGRTTPPPPGLCCWRKILRRFFRSVGFWRTRIAARSRTEFRATMRTSGGRCRRRSTGPLLSSTATPGIRCASWG
jgi:predicted HTH transcriptional regulator